MTHTPGPWKRQFAINGIGNLIVTVDSLKQPEGGYFEICRQELEGEPQESIERIKADFAILAAAPELLEALEDVRRNLAKARNVGADRNALILDAEEIARAAIAKAKGQQS